MGKKQGTPFLDQQQLQQPGQPQQQQQQHIPVPNGGSFAAFDGASGTCGSGNVSLFGDATASCNHELLQAFAMQPWTSAPAPGGLQDSSSGVFAPGQPCPHHSDSLMASAQAELDKFRKLSHKLYPVSSRLTEAM